MQLADARGFMFDLDGTLVQRSPSGVVAVPGAREVMAAIRGSGRPLVVFTNASHVGPAHIAAGVRKGGLELADDEVLTPVCSALSHLRRRHAGARVLVVGTDAAKEQMTATGLEVLADEEAASAEVVLVLHVDAVDLAVLEACAHAILAGARFLVGNYVRAYAGADGPIISRGAMAAAAIAKATGRRPTVVGKPSRAAMREVSQALGVTSREVAVIGDDLEMDIALGRLGGAHTVLVRSGISGADPKATPPARRPDLVVGGVGDLLGRL